MTNTLMQPLAAETARNNRHFQLIVDVHLLLLSDGDLLLGRRANTGYGDGAYEPPSDRLAERETLVEAAVRVELDQLANRPVKDYLEVLTERAAKKRLKSAVAAA